MTRHSSRRTCSHLDAVRAFFESGNTTGAQDLATRIGVSKDTAYWCVRRLVDEGVIHVIGTFRGTDIHGRPNKMPGDLYGQISVEPLPDAYGIVGRALAARTVLELAWLQAMLQREVDDAMTDDTECGATA